MSLGFLPNHFLRIGHFGDMAHFSGAETSNRFIVFFIQHIIHQQDEGIGIPEISLDDRAGHMARAKKSRIGVGRIYPDQFSFN